MIHATERYRTADGVAGVDGEAPLYRASYRPQGIRQGRVLVKPMVAPMVAPLGRTKGGRTEDEEANIAASLCY